MEVDWSDQTRRDRIRAYVVQPTNLDVTRYELGGVLASESSLSGTYYGSTRCSGKLTLLSGDWRGWDRNGFVRIVHEVEGTSYSRELGTFIVGDDQVSWEGGSAKVGLTLQSALYALKSDVLPHSLVVRRGASWTQAIRQLLDAVHRPCVVSATDRRCGADTVYETGKGRLDSLMAMCSAGGYRADVDGHGRVTIRDYRMPVARTRTFSLDMTSPSGLVHDGVSFSTDWLGRPSLVVANQKWSDQVNGKTVEREIIGTASVGPGAANHPSKRGYTVARYVSIQDDKAHRTNAFVNQQAKATLDSDQWEDAEFEVTTQYLPVWEGDVGTITLPAGASYGGYSGTVAVVVKSADLDLGKMQLKMTLKVVNARDTEGDD